MQTTCEETSGVDIAAFYLYAGDTSVAPVLLFILARMGSSVVYVV